MLQFATVMMLRTLNTYSLAWTSLIRFGQHFYYHTYTSSVGVFVFSTGVFVFSTVLFVFSKKIFVFPTGVFVFPTGVFVFEAMKPWVSGAASAYFSLKCFLSWTLADVAKCFFLNCIFFDNYNLLPAWLGQAFLLGLYSHPVICIFLTIIILT